VIEAGSIRHRRDIDGLRAFAVLPITLFHAGISGLSGGYVGVDIFFVISGFLITSILARDHAAGSFSFVKFYERRIRRIFPALAAMMLFTIIAGYFILLPSEIHDFASSVIGTILFASNIVFYKQSGYFDMDAAYKPLLHTWSLGVEEQFYVGFPILLMLIMRYRPQNSRLLLGLCSAVSLFLCIYLMPQHPTATFYLIPMRAWELLAGSLVALGLLPKVTSDVAGNTLAALGMALIIAAIMFFDENTLFPGYAALLPVAGTVLVIAYADSTLTGKLLSFGPIAFVGLVSYSLYLWHWPLIVFGRDLGLLDGTIGPALAVIALSLAAAYASYRWVETPFRNRGAIGQLQIYRYAGIAAAALLAVGAGFFYSDGMRSRFSENVLALDDSRSDFSPMRQACHPGAGIADPAHMCVFGGKAADTAMWSDSHGVELAYALGNNSHPLLSLTYSSCPPALDFNVASQPDCREHNRRAADYLIRNQAIHTVVMTAHYVANIGSADFQNGFVKSVVALRRAGKNVVIVGPVPAEGMYNVPMQLARHGPFTMTRQDYETRQKSVIAMLLHLQAMGAQIVWPADQFCDALRCNATLGGKPILFDEDHLSLTAATYLASVVAPTVWHAPIQH